MSPTRVFWDVLLANLRGVPGVERRLWMDHSVPAGRSLTSTHVRCDADMAFDYVSDFERHSEWTTGEVRIEKLTPGPTRLGTKLRAQGFQGGHWWPAEIEVTAFDRPYVFQFTASGGPIASPTGRPHRHTYRFTSEGHGIRLAHEREDPTEPRLLWHLLGPIVIRATGGVRVATTRNLRDRLEAISAESKGG